MEIRIETETFRKMDTAVVGMFSQIDANGDGVVTMRELTMALRKDRGLGKRLGLRFADGEIQDRDGSRKEIEEFFSRHDVDDVTGLQLHEFYTALRPGGPPRRCPITSPRRCPPTRTSSGCSPPWTPRARLRMRRFERYSTRSRKNPSFRRRSGWRWTA